MKNEQWTIAAKGADFAAIGKQFGIDPVIARIIRNRDVIGEEEIARFLHGSVRNLHDPMLLRDMDRAVKILKDRIGAGAKLRIVGDYDIDGVMASYILQKGLQRLGAVVDVRIPVRTRDGYGISERMVREAYDEGVDTIITCDNGIAASDQVHLAKELGMTVIVTDHHGVVEIPPADAVINPHRPDCTYPYKELCGAGVAFKLVDALYRTFVGEDPSLEGEIEEFLSYVAFATVGDIVDLTDENRILVKEGLLRLRKTNNVGLRALCRVLCIAPEEIDTYHIGFILGPCINASGRLDSAMLAYELLIAEEEQKANVLALNLKNLNDSRKALTEEGVAIAQEMIDAHRAAIGEKVFVLFLPTLHESIAGIVAGRIREIYAHPVYVLTRSGDTVKGSGRSIEGYPMFEQLKSCADLLLRYGGHPMAAGLSLQEENIEALRERLNETCDLSEEDFAEKVRIDVDMPLSYITEELVRELSVLAPFGKANPRPVFAIRNVRAASPRLLGAKKNVLKMTLTEESGRTIEAIAFRDVDNLLFRVMDDPQLQVVYYPQINDYGGVRSLQVVVEHWR